MPEKKWKSKRGRKPKKLHDELFFDAENSDMKEQYDMEDSKIGTPSADSYDELSRENLANAPTYIDMIEEAINALGGHATTPDITNFMEEKHGQLLLTKTKTWRNSVSGCLSTHFQRLVSKDQLGRIVWTLKPKDPKMELKREKERLALAANKMRVKPTTSPIPVSPSLRKNDVPTAPIIPPKFKAPGRSTSTLKRLFDPKHLEELIQRNKAPGTTENYQGIEFINKAHPLEIMNMKLENPGPVYAMAWSVDGTMLATANIVGTIRIWDAKDWTLLQEVQHKQVLFLVFIK
jgi:hypothetical protein